MDMRFHWLRDRENRNQFKIYWRPGKTNLADYWTKHHPAKHHSTAKYSTAQIAAKNLYSRFCSKTQLANTVQILQDWY
jgi:hypothetical protein